MAGFNLADPTSMDPRNNLPQSAPEAASPDPLAGMSPQDQVAQMDADSGADQYSPDYWRGVTARARALPNKLIAGGAAGVNTLGYGIPDVILKAASSDTYKKLKDLQAANPGATALGTGAGLVLGLGTGATESKLPILGAGGLAGLASRGLSKVGLEGAGEAVGNVARFMANGGAATTTAGKIGQGALQGAALGAEQNIIPVIGGTETPIEGALGTAAGGVAGAAIPAVTSAFAKIPESLQAINEWGNKVMAKRGGVNQRDLRTLANTYLHGDPEAVEGLMKNLGTEVRDNELWRKPNRTQYVDDTKQQWQEWEQAWNDTYKTDPAQAMADLTAKVQADPDAANAIARGNAAGAAGTEGDDLFNTMVKKLDATSGLADKREYLAKIAYDNTGKYGDDEMAIARSLRDGLDDQARTAAGMTPDQWTAMKTQYPLKVLIQKGAVRDEASLAGLTPQGSDTAAKLALSGIGMTASASTLGNPKGLLEDPTNPERWGQFVAATMGGSAVGFTKNLIANNLARIAMRLDGPGLQALIDKVGAAPSIQAIQKIAAQAEASWLSKPTAAIARGASTVPATIGSEGNQNVQAMDAGKAPLDATTYTGQASTPSPSAAADGIQPQAQPQAAVTAQVEANASPKQASDATYATNQKYQSAINQALHQHWLEVARYVSEDDFRQQVANATDNFNPLYSAKILFSDGRAQEQYLKDYQAALQLKGANASDVWDQNRHTSIFDSQQKVKQEGYTRLIDTIGAAIDGKAPSASTVRTVKDHLDGIMRQPISAEQKNQQVLEFMKTYGFGAEQLSAIGLI